MVFVEQKPRKIGNTYRCQECDKYKDISEFYRDKTKRYDIGGSCKRCAYFLRSFDQDCFYNILFFIYSNGTMKCVVCSEDDTDLLTLEHVGGGGNKIRELQKLDNFKIFHKQYIRGELPSLDEIDVLCRNCNWRRRLELQEGKNKLKYNYTRTRCNVEVGDKD